MTSEPIQLGDQRAFRHVEPFARGSFVSFDALALGDGPPRRAHVYVPREVTQPAPLLVLLDGQSAFFGPRSLHAAEAIDALVTSGAIEPTVVAAIHPLDRDLEYTHAPWADGRASGGVAAHADWLAGSLLPFLQSAFPVRADAATTTIAGTSHAGLAAFWTAVLHKERVGAAICLSASFWIGVEYGLVVRRESGEQRGSALWAAARSSLEELAGRPRFWLDWGLRDDTRAERRGRELAALLRDELGYEEGLELFAHEDPLGGHDEAAWAFRLKLALSALHPRRAPPP